jgi:diguanylate cyclase (GGDEF)-like protein
LPIWRMPTQHGERDMKDHALLGLELLPSTAMPPAAPPVRLTAAQRELVMRSDLLQGVAPAAIQSWLTDAPVRWIQRGDTLIHIGVAHNTLFVLLSGELSVWLESQPPAANAGVQRGATACARKQIARIGPGETAGEQSLISMTDGQLPIAWAIAHEDCCVLAVPSAMFWQSMQAEPKIALNLLRVLSARVRKANAGFSEALAQQQRLTQDAETDALTGLYNRRWMDRHYPRALLCKHAAQKSASILMIDLDHFKRVNDEHGHAVGDQVLFQAARRIEFALRPGDLCARYGGEEFCVLLQTVDLPLATGIAQRICASVARQPFALSSGATLPVSVSIGVACWDQQEPLDALLHAADGALYQAKRQGRNRVIAVQRPVLV